MPDRLARHRAIRRVRVLLERGGFPRLQMLLIVTLPAASGFLASYALLGAESGSSVGGVVRGHVRVGHGAVCAGAQSIADVLLRAKGLR